MLTRSRFVSTPEKQNTKCEVVKEYNTCSVPSTDIPSLSPPLLSNNFLAGSGWAFLWTKVALFFVIPDGSVKPIRDCYTTHPQPCAPIPLYEGGEGNEGKQQSLYKRNSQKSARILFALFSKLGGSINDSCYF